MIYHGIRCHIQGNSNIHSYRRDNLKSLTVNVWHAAYEIHNVSGRGCHYNDTSKYYF
jgi:hypothetical protein